MNTEKTGKVEKTGPEKTSREKSAPETSPPERSQTGPPTVSRAAPAVDHPLDQVREILFGAIYRDLEQSLARADAHVSTRLHDLEQEGRRRTEVLEAHLKKETEILAARLDRQIVEINDVVRDLIREQREAAEQAVRKIAKAEEANATGLRELRHQLLEQSKSFLDELKEVRREMLATFQRELALREGELVEERDEIDSGSPH